MGNAADTLFSLVDHELDLTTRRIYGKLMSIVSTSMDLKEQHSAVQIVIRDQLDEIVQEIFGIFDNVGSTLPDGVVGFRISDAENGSDIRVENDDYAAMWLDFLALKPHR